MEGLYKEGRIRAIGVSNFGSDRIIDFCNNADVIPAVNQIELHPFYQRDDELAILKEYGITPQAWATFAEGLNGMFSNPILREIAKAHNRPSLKSFSAGICSVVSRSSLNLSTKTV